MQQYISLREANQHLSRYINAVKEGNEIVITCRGKPVARLLPVEVDRILSNTQQAARKRALARMRAGYHLGGQRIVRDDIYGRQTLYGR